ncbi:MAG: hypothetical protein PHV34_17765 [Verrucomicrobiae bacterium]|nr:hypothetical protein [Verrucomicrobiae bacterium]
MKKIQKKTGAQAMAEYIIIVAVVALAALAVFGLFGDTIRAKMSGIIAAFGGEATGTDTSTAGEDVGAGTSAAKLKSLDKDGNNN